MVQFFEIWPPSESTENLKIIYYVCCSCSGDRTNLHFLNHFRGTFGAGRHILKTRIIIGRFVAQRFVFEIELSGVNPNDKPSG